MEKTGGMVLLGKTTSTADRSEGAYRCRLDEDAALDWLSTAVCLLLKRTPEDAYLQSKGHYINLVHPDDRAAYQAFLDKMSQGETEGVLQYCLLAKDGSAVAVREAMISTIKDDGHLWGISKVYGLSKEAESEADGTCGLPTAMLQQDIMTLSCQIAFSYGSSFKILSANDAAMFALGISAKDASSDLDAAYHLLEFSSMKSLEGIAMRRELEGASILGDLLMPVPGAALRRVDGSILGVSCWASCFVDPHFGRVCQMAFVPFPFEQFVRIEDQVANFTSFMATAFDAVFHVDYEKHAATCIATKLGPDWRVPLGLPLHLPDALDNWVDAFVLPEDRYIAKGLYDLEGLLNHGESRQASYRAECNGQMLVFDVMIVGVVGGAVILYKVADTLMELECDEETCRQGEAFLPEGARARALSQEVMFEAESKGIFIRTFGHFDVFVNGKAVLFPHEKAKEYLALLVDRRGAWMSSRELARLLFNGEDTQALARGRKAAMYLMRTLSAYGIEHIIEKEGNSRHFVAKDLTCDLFDFFDFPDEEKRSLLSRSYMNEYSWSESTKEELLRA